MTQSGSRRIVKWRGQLLFSAVASFSSAAAVAAHDTLASSPGAVILHRYIYTAIQGQVQRCLCFLRYNLYTHIYMYTHTNRESSISVYVYNAYNAVNSLSPFLTPFYPYTPPRPAHPLHGRPQHHLYTYIYIHIIHAGPHCLISPTVGPDRA